MLFVRAVVLLLLLAGLACFALYFATGQARYRAIGIRLIRWTVVAALVFFGVLIVERLAEMV